MLPDADIRYLEEHHAGYTAVLDAGMICVVLPSFQLPAGFTVDASDLLLRLAALYPDQPPDMWWFDPAVMLSSGVEIPATQLVETYIGRTWQRWSRHLDPQQWITGVDGLQSYVRLIRTDLARYAPAVA